MDEAELPPLPKGECYIKDILGFDVVTTQGETLGQLQNVIKETAQSLYVVETPEGKKIYIPGVPAFILEKNLETKKITVNLPEGLLDL